MVKRNIVFLSMMVFTALFLVGCSSGVVEIERPVVDDNDIDEQVPVDTRPYFVMAPPEVVVNSSPDEVLFFIGYDVTQARSSARDTGDYNEVQVYTYVKVPRLSKESEEIAAPEVNVPWGENALPVCADDASMDKFCTERGFDGGEIYPNTFQSPTTCALWDGVRSWSEGRTQLQTANCYNYVSSDEHLVSEEVFFNLSDSAGFTGGSPVFREFSISWDDFEQYCGKEVMVGSIVNPGVDDVISVDGDDELFANKRIVHIEETDTLDVFPALLKKYEDTVQIVCN